MPESANRLRRRVEVPRAVAVAGFSLLAGGWLVLFLFDAGNFRHGGTAAGLVVTESVAALGLLAFVEVVRSDAARPIKFALALPAAALVLFTASGLLQAAHRVLAA